MMDGIKLDICIPCVSQLEVIMPPNTRFSGDRDSDRDLKCSRKQRQNTSEEDCRAATCLFH